MSRYFFIVLLAISLYEGPKAFAEEQGVTTALFSQLSSSTITGYIDSSILLSPGALNLSVSLPNGMVSSVTPKDVLLLRWSMKAKKLSFVRTFIAAKKAAAVMNADDFDSRYLQILMSLSQFPTSQSRVFGGSGSHSPF